MPMGGEAASANSLKLGYKPVAKMPPNVAFWIILERLGAVQ